MQFTEPDREEQDYLLSVARKSIEHGLSQQPYRPILPPEFPELDTIAATFVTLKSQSDSLRGCIGTLQAKQPLYLSVAHNAAAAAFNDPRFPAVKLREWPALKLSISILSTATAMTVTSEQHLKQQLRPGIDGLILKDQQHTATFLPAVWEELPDVNEFLKHLKMKAGLKADHWSESIEFFQYQSFSFSGKAVPD